MSHAITSAAVSNSPPTEPGITRDGAIRRIYFTGFSLVYLLAFVSLWVQIHGLVGEQGLLPVSRFLTLVHDKLGADAYRLLPSLIWLGSGDVMLHFWCAVGVILSALLIAGLAPRLALVGLWVVYLSLSIAGQAFLSFQWDSLLLEMTACSILYAPRGLRPLWHAAPSSMPLGRWLLWALAFKLMFLSGVTKLLSGDSSWSDGTALQFHYYTQPIPNWISWYAYQLPLATQRVSLWGMLVVELLLPFLVFAGDRARAVFGLATIVLMIVIELTGNFGFFNLQTAVLCMPLLNDHLLRRIFPRLRFTLKYIDTAVNRPRWRIVCGNGLAAVILFVSLLATVREMVRTQRPDSLPPAIVTVLGWADKGLLSWSESTILKYEAPFRTINGYGLFRVMTTHRPEIVVEISDDGESWTACEFPYKPGNVDRAPPIVAPHMPRLDWQMWFAALNPRGNADWLSSLMQRILEGNRSTCRLLGHPELADHPPQFARLAYYEYKFSSPEQRRASGAWWSRSHSGYLTKPVSRRAAP